MYLPDDLVREILLKITSAEALCKLSFVCKAWRDFIKVINNKIMDTFVVFYKHKSNGHYLMRSCTQNSQKYFGRVAGIPCHSRGMVGSCNGILCLRTHETHSLLYNPITHEYKTLPVLNNDSFGSQGFGFDSSTNDYKVISICGRYHAEIYKLSTNSWSRLSNVDLGVNVDGYSMSARCVYVNGFCYWRLYYTSSYEIFHGRILAFNFQSQTFRHIKFPEEIGIIYCNDLGVVDDSLALCRLVTPKSSKNAIDTEVWMLSEGEGRWIKKFTVKSVNLVRSGGACWFRGGSSVFQLNIEKEQVINLGYKEEENKAHKARTRMFRFDSTKEDRAMIFNPSLVSLGSGRFWR